MQAWLLCFLFAAEKRYQRCEEDGYEQQVCWSKCQRPIGVRTLCSGKAELLNLAVVLHDPTRLTDQMCH
jgi:hypothetical protein